VAQASVATDWTEVELPYGWWRGDEVTHSASVRAIAGEDELALQSSLAKGASPLAAATLLIERCARAGEAPVDADALVMGDREVLLRAIYAASVAPAFEALVTCDCGAEMHFDVDLGRLTAAVPEAGPRHRLRIGGREVQIRLPVGADVAAAISSDAPEKALLRACAGGARSRVVTEALARLDPNAECAIELECAECGRRTTTFLDAFDILSRALGEGGDMLRQVDLLARIYGWSEAEILALPRHRRRRYCALAAA
jgi:hypothetical protein